MAKMPTPQQFASGQVKNGKVVKKKAKPKVTHYKETKTGLKKVAGPSAAQRKAAAAAQRKSEKRRRDSALHHRRYLAKRSAQRKRGFLGIVKKVATAAVAANPATAPLLLTKVKKIREAGYTALDKTYETGAKLNKARKIANRASDSVVRSPTMGGVPLKPKNNKHNRKLEKKLEGLPKTVKKQVQIANKKADKKLKSLPGGKQAAKGIEVAGYPLKKQAEGAVKAAKAIWHSDEVIKATAKGKSPKKIAAASQGKEKTPGKSFFSKDFQKRHKGAAILLGGAVDFAAQAPLAVATGGEGTIAEMTAKQAAQDVIKAETKAAMKREGVRSARSLSAVARKEIDRKAAEAAKRAHKAASARYGKQRDAYVGIDFKKPGSGERVRKVVGVKQSVKVPTRKALKKELGPGEVRSRNLADATQKMRRGLDKAEVKHPSVARLRNAAHAPNRTLNPNATPRHQEAHGDYEIKHQGAVTRNREEQHTRDARNLEESLNALQKEKGLSDKEWNDYKKKLLTEVEQHGAKAPSQEARNLHRLFSDSHQGLVSRGLDKPWAGQRVVEYDKKNLIKGAKRDKETLKRGHVTTRTAVARVRSDTDLARRHPTEGYTIPKSGGMKHETKGRIVRAPHPNEALALQAAQFGEKVAANNRKRLDNLIEEIKAAPETKDIKETETQLGKWIKEADSIGAKKLSKRLHGLRDEKRATPAHWTPRVKARPENALPSESSPWARNKAKRVNNRKSRVKRTQTVEQAMDAKDKSGASIYDFSNKALASSIERNHVDVDRANFWATVRDHVTSEPEHAKGGGWYVIDKRGPSDMKVSRDAAEKAAKNAKQKFDKDARVVHLSEETVGMLKREAAISRRPLDENDFVRIGKNANGLWKKLAISTPSNRAKNLAGDTSRMVAFGGRLKNMRQAGRLAGPKGAFSKSDKFARSADRWTQAHELKDGAPISPAVAKFREKTAGASGRTYGDYFDEMRQMGVPEGGLVRGEVAEGVVKGGVRSATTKAGRGVDKWNRAVSQLETWPRAASYIAAREAGLTKQQAMRAVHEALFDYTKASHLEEFGRRTVTPFIVWRGRNAATLIAHFIRKPGKIKQYETIFNTMAQGAGYDNMEDLMNDVGERAWNLPLPVPGTKGGTANLGLPVGDIEEMYKLARSGRGLESLGSNIPLLRLADPLVLKAEGKSPSQYAKPAPVPLDKLAKVPGIKQILGLHEGEDLQGNKGIFLGNIGGTFYAFISPETGLSARTAGKSKKEALTALANFATGAGYQPRRPFQGEIDKLTAQISKIDNQLKGSPPTATFKALSKKQRALKDKRKELYGKQDRALGKKTKTKTSGGRKSGGPFSGGANPFNSSNGPFSGSANPFK